MSATEPVLATRAPYLRTSGSLMTSLSVLVTSTTTGWEPRQVRSRVVLTCEGCVHLRRYVASWV